MIATEARPKRKGNYGPDAQKNFERRFGNPPRITVKYVEIPAAELSWRREDIANAFLNVASSLAGRKLDIEELFVKGPEELFGKGQGQALPQGEIQ